MIFFSFLLSFLGFLDATYLTILHYKNIIPPCSLAHGCETVLTSKFSTIGPVPIALLGVIYYLGVLGLLGMLLQSKSSPVILSERSESKDPLTTEQEILRLMPQDDKRIKTLLLLLTSTGLIVSIVLVGIQAFILHAYCQWCLTSEGINLLLFLLALRIKLIK